MDINRYIELFRYQAQHCAPYADYLRALDVDWRDVERVEDIPYLPIEVFRSRKVYSADTEPEQVFTSSATGGEHPSRHYVASLANYRRTFRLCWEERYGAPEEYSFYALLPNYLERSGSSLVYMLDSMIGWGGGGFYLYDYERLLADMAADPKPKVLWGVTYALLDLAEKYAPPLADIIVIETGGMKGRREELPKEELHRILCDSFGVERIHSEYGMAELNSQAYSCGSGIFECSSTMQVSVREVSDPSVGNLIGVAGGLNIIDLANRDSCSFIATQDLGIVHEDGTFNLCGRVEHSQIRGCNLLVTG